MKKALILFTRIPIEGQTKTRLQKNLGAEKSVEIHKAILKDLNEEFKKTDADKFVYHTDNGKCSLLKELFTEDCIFLKQKGDNIWDRMRYCMLDVFDRGYDRIILIGADIPEIDSEHLNMCFNMLEEYDMVITPTFDMGYCLIGLKKETLKETVRAFDMEDCINDTVIDHTISLAGDDMKIFKTGKLIDIDEEEDIVDFMKNYKGKSYNLYKLLKSYGY